MKIHSGSIIYRSLTPQHGLQETRRPFSSLKELFTLVLEAEAPYLVDRIAITGEDEAGNGREVNFVFQSIRVVKTGS